DAARDSHSRGRTSPRARPADCSFFVGALAALAAAAGNLVAKPLLDRRLESADGTAARLAAARPGSLGLASAGALSGGNPQRHNPRDRAHLFSDDGLSILVGLDPRPVRTRGLWSSRCP